MVDRCLQLAGDKLAAAASNTRKVQLRLRLLADQWAEIALIDQFAHRDLIGDIGEQRPLALMQHAALETIGRRREADHLEFWIDGGKPLNKPAVHGGRCNRDQMRLVYEDEVAVTDFHCTAMHRLDAGEENARIRLAPPEPGGIDPRRSLGPQPHHLGVVLGNEFAGMGDDEDALVGPRLEHALGERRKHQGFPRSCRKDQQRVALVILKIRIDGIDGFLLVGTERQHDSASASPRASLSQLEPSFMR